MCSVQNSSDVEIWLDLRTDPSPCVGSRRVHGHGPPLTWVWAGELDAADVDDLRATWWSILRQEPCYVVIDLAAVTFLDCRILSFLVSARSEAGSLFLRSVSPAARRLLTLARLDDLLAPVEPEPLTSVAA